MKVKALAAFVGAFGMHCGEVKDIPDIFAADLIRNGLAEAYADDGEKTIKAVDADDNIADNTKRRKKRTADRL